MSNYKIIVPPVSHQLMFCDDCGPTHLFLWAEGHCAADKSTKNDGYN